MWRYYVERLFIIKGGIMKVSYTKTFDKAWHLIERTVASLQLDAFGIIFVDEKNHPIADSRKLEELYDKYKNDCETMNYLLGRF